MSQIQCFEDSQIGGGILPQLKFQTFSTIYLHDFSLLKSAHILKVVA